MCAKLTGHVWSFAELFKTVIAGEGCGLGPMVECPAGKLARFLMRFTIRDVVLVTVIVALVAALLIERRGRHNDQIATVRWASAEEQEWMRERFKAAKAEFQQVDKFWRGRFSSNLPVSDTCNAVERYAQAAEELPADAETRTKEIAAALEFVKFLENITQDKFNADVEPQLYLNRVQYARAEVETRLRRVHRELILERSRQ